MAFDQVIQAVQSLNAEDSFRPRLDARQWQLFGDSPRMAQVEAMSPCTVWALPRHRLDEMALRQPSMALEVLRSLGAVMVARMQANLERGLPLA